jgi:hypothetical protein
MPGGSRSAAGPKLGGSQAEPSAAAYTPPDEYVQGGKPTNMSEHYPTRLQDISDALERSEKGESWEIGKSAGGRPIWAIAYGEKEPVEHSANLSSALAAGRPEAFFGDHRREKPVLLIHAAAHGAEMEGIAATLNLVSVMETGADLKGQEWPGLAAARGMRLVIVPCLNPDGRARVPADDPTVWTEDEVEQYRHGLHADGSRIGWPECKVPHPRDPEADGVLGAYFNDAGVNPLHGVFLSPTVAPETHSIMALALDETPDCVLDMHSCSAGPFFIVGGGALPERLSRRQFYIDGFFRDLMRQRLGVHRPWTTEGGEGVLTLDTAYYHLCHALPLVFESTDGTDPERPFSHEQIVDSQLIAIEALVTIGTREGFRPS